MKFIIKEGRYVHLKNKGIVYHPQTFEQKDLHTPMELDTLLRLGVIVQEKETPKAKAKSKDKPVDKPVDKIDESYF